MHNIQILEAYYRKFTNDLNQWLPEDIIDVNQELLEQLNLHEENYNHDDSLTRYFHVVESEDKITLINDQYVIWIVPEKMDDSPVTFTFIAINSRVEPQLELCFVTSGVYNTSKLVLRLLEKFLTEFEENEKVIENLENSSK